MSANPAPAVTLREITAADRDFLIELYAGTRSDELAQVAWSAEEKRTFLTMQFEAQSRAYSEYQNISLLIICVDRQSVGRLYVARWPEEIRIVDISIVDAFRGRGIGGSLLRGLIDEGRESKRALGIHVERFNRALGLYLQHGFEVTADKGIYLYLRRPPR